MQEYRNPFKKSELLTDLIHHFNFIFANPAAAVIINVLSSLEVLTFDTMPVQEIPQVKIKYGAVTD